MKLSVKAIWTICQIKMKKTGDFRDLAAAFLVYEINWDFSYKDFKESIVGEIEHQEGL